jgi:hypothetical protein
VAYYRSLPMLIYPFAIAIFALLAVPCFAQSVQSTVNASTNFGTSNFSGNLTATHDPSGILQGDYGSAVIDPGADIDQRSIGVTSGYDINAETEPGINSASLALTGYANQSYLNMVVSSVWSDTFDFTAAGASTLNGFESIDTPAFVSFIIDINNASFSATGPAGVNLEVSANTGPVPSGSGVMGTGSEAGTFNVFDEAESYTSPPWDTSLYDPTTSDDFYFQQGSGTERLTTQSYAVTDNGGVYSVSPTVELTIDAGDTAWNGGSVTANFSDPASFTDLDVYNAAGDLIPQSDLVITPASGAAYPFQSGPTAAPESSTIVEFCIGMLVFGTLIYRRNRIKLSRQ